MRSVIVNLTQHNPTAEQYVAGVVNLLDFQRDEARAFLNFAEMPDDISEVITRAERLAEMVAQYFGVSINPEILPCAMIGGAPFMMAPLERALKERGIMPCYAFSVRESVEVTAPDGTVTKTSVFKHKGFVFA